MITLASPERPMQLAQEVGAFELIGEVARVSPQTVDHSIRVANMAYAGATAIGSYSPWVQDAVWLAGLLHDNGKKDPEIAQIIDNDRDLTPEESAKVARHPELSAEGVDDVIRDADNAAKTIIVADSMTLAREVALGHHESLKGVDNISGSSPLARMIDFALLNVIIADRIDAKCADDRLYRKPSNIRDMTGVGFIIRDGDFGIEETGMDYRIPASIRDNPTINSVLFAMKSFAVSRGYYGE